MRQLTRGFTLIEVMVAIAIMSILSMAALPALGDYQANSRLREGANTLVSAAVVARNEALKLNQQVTLSSDGIVLQVTPGAGASATAIARTITLPARVQLSPFTVTFAGSGLLDPFGANATVSTSTPGQNCSADIRCPSVFIEAGGDARVCPTGVCS